MAVAWPARLAQRRQRKWQREPEPWEANGELFAGELVLRDLEASHENATGTQRIIARYVVVRLWERVRTEPPGMDSLIEARRNAEQYLTLIGEGDAERRVLGTLVQAGRAQKRVIATLLAAGHAAESQRHVYGAFRLYRGAYEMAVQQGWAAEGAKAARAIERSALHGGGLRSAQLWDRRARALERRAETG
jgi:hypothetical protein